MQDDIRSALGFDGLLHRVLRITLAAPVNRLGVLLIRKREDLHFLADHEGGIETETEMADDSLCAVFVFVYKLLRTGERDLVDVFIHLLGGHSDTMVGNGQGLLGLINTYAHAKVAQITLHFTNGRQSLQFLRSIDGIGDQLTQEDLVIRIQKFLDDGEDIITRHPNITFTHIICILKNSLLL